MIEEGRVVRIKDGQALVEFKRREVCDRCGICFVGEDKKMFVEVENPLGAKPGNVVRIEIESGQVLWASFVLYMLPLIFIFLGYGVGLILARFFQISNSSQVFGIAFALLFLALSFYLVWRIDKEAGERRKQRPVITKVV